MILKENADKEDISDFGEYVEELALFIYSAAPMDLRCRAWEKSKLR